MSSPDLNPIENAWYILEQYLQKKTPRTIDGLWRCMRKGWAKIDGTQVAESIADLSAQPMAVKKRFDSVIGHFTFGFHQQFSGKYTYITFLRNPVSRVVSLFNHIKNVPQHPLHEVVASRAWIFTLLQLAT